MRILSLFIALFLIPINSLCAQELEAILESVSNQEAFWSLTVLDEDGNKIESVNSDKLIIPASNQKLYTLAAVLDRLGSDFRYTTNIYGDGELVGSIWEGILIISGVGDPSISGDLYNNDREYVFKEFLDQLKEIGIDSLTGKIIPIKQYFDNQYYPKGWSWDDLSFYYGVQIDDLSYNNNAVDLEVTADGIVGEDKPNLKWFPDNTNYVNFINRQSIISKNMEYDEFYRRKLGSNIIDLGSGLPKGYYEKESLSIENPSLFFVDSFAKFLNRNGLKFNQEEFLQYDWFQGGQVLASHTSKPLSGLIKWANKESDNFYTEMMLKTLAAEEQGIPGTFENGIKEVRNFLAEQGVDTILVKMNDGSGLAMGNYTTTGNISRLLYSMKSHRESDVFYNSFSIAGIDGSIKHRFKGTELYNNLRAKTGYVSGVRMLSGYMTASSGKQITFSLATNHFAGKVSPVDKDHQKILEYLYAKY